MNQRRTSQQLTHEPADRKVVLTLGELRWFVIDSNEMPDDAEVNVRIGWSSQIQTITATGEADRPSWEK